MHKVYITISDKRPFRLSDFDFSYKVSHGVVWMAVGQVDGELLSAFCSLYAMANAATEKADGGYLNIIRGALANVVMNILEDMMEGEEDLFMVEEYLNCLKMTIGRKPSFSLLKNMSPKSPAYKYADSFARAIAAAASGGLPGSFLSSLYSCVGLFLEMATANLYVLADCAVGERREMAYGGVSTLFIVN